MQTTIIFIVLTIFGGGPALFIAGCSMLTQIGNPLKQKVVGHVFAGLGIACWAFGAWLLFWSSMHPSPLDVFSVTTLRDASLCLGILVVVLAILWFYIGEFPNTHMNIGWLDFLIDKFSAYKFLDKKTSLGKFDNFLRLKIHQGERLLASLPNDGGFFKEIPLYGKPSVFQHSGRYIVWYQQLVIVLRQAIGATDNWKCGPFQNGSLTHKKSTPQWNTRQGLIDELVWLKNILGGCKSSDLNAEFKPETLWEYEKL